jgi:hypothetical protein
VCGLSFFGVCFVPSKQKSASSGEVGWLHQDCPAEARTFPGWARVGSVSQGVWGGRADAFWAGGSDFDEHGTKWELQRRRIAFGANASGRWRIQIYQSQEPMLHFLRAAYSWWI